VNIDLVEHDLLRLTPSGFDDFAPSLIASRIYTLGEIQLYRDTVGILHDSIGEIKPSCLRFGSLKEPSLAFATSETPVVLKLRALLEEVCDFLLELERTIKDTVDKC
jgi:hypothetical protein